MKTRREELLEGFPDYGPDWRAAIEFGIDVSLLEENLRRSPLERLEQLVGMIRFLETARAARPHGADEPT